MKWIIAGMLAMLAVSPNTFAEANPLASDSQAGMSSEFVYKYLVGEVAGQRGDLSLASQLFLDLAKSSKDARLAERATKAAVYGSQGRLAMESAVLWAELDPTSIEAQQATAQMLIATGRLDEAKPYLQKLLLKEDTRANGFLYLNSLFARQADKKVVLSLMQELAVPYPGLPEARFAVAHAAWVAGDAQLAAGELDKADNLRPGWETGALLRGQLLSGQSPETPLQFYRNFLRQYPDANEVRLALARILVNQKLFEEAKNEFVRLVASAKGNPEMMVVVGLLASQSGDYAEANKYFRQALDANFKSPDQVHLYLGQVAEKQKNDAEALNWYNKVQPGEQLLQAKFNIAGIVARTQNVDSAIAMLDELQDLDSGQLGLVVQMQANLLNQAKRHQEAYDLLEKAMSNVPNTPEMIYDFAMTAERLKRHDVEENQLRKLIQIKPDFVQAYNALGYSLADRNVRLNEALGLIEKAHALSPDDHYILDSLGWVNYRLGKLDAALKHLQRAYNVQDDAEIAAHLGEVLWKSGRHEEAQKIWSDALDKSPDNEVLRNTVNRFKL